jgi:hypothetical protein
MILSGCIYNTQREKHFYLGYGEKGYLHYPCGVNEWLTVEIESPKYGEKLKPETEDDAEIINIESLENE